MPWVTLDNSGNVISGWFANEQTDPSVLAGQPSQTLLPDSDPRIKALYAAAPPLGRPPNFVPPLATAQADAINALRMTANAAVTAQLWMQADPNFASWAQQVQTAYQQAVNQVNAATTPAQAQAVTMTVPAAPTPANKPAPTPT